MSRSTRYGLLIAALALVAAGAFITHGGSLQAQSSSVAISGQMLDLYTNEPRSFSNTSDARIINGLEHPVSIICPGNIDIAATFSGFPSCVNPSGNGMRGWIVSKEKLVRSYINPASPTFESESYLAFSGSVIMSGKSYFGTMLIKLVKSGPLNTPVGIDCQVTPENSLCGARSYTGTWEIVPGQGGGDLRAVLGSGTVNWLGCLDPANPATCAFPTYDGSIYLKYDTFIPLYSDSD